MPYNGTMHIGNEAVRKAVKGVFMLKVADAVLEKAEKMQEVHSSFKDPGVHWSRYDFFDAEGRELGSVTLAGY